MSARRVVSLVACSLVAAACSIGETNYETFETPARKVSEVKTCGGAFANPDLGSLTACGDGKGHCYDGAKTSLVGLPPCAAAGEVCVPDKVLAANGGKLKSCTFFIENKPGACLSRLVDRIEANKDQLKQDVCEPDERCSPCINPRNGQDTHLCDANGVYEAPCKGGPGAQEDACCHGQGVCMNTTAVPEDSREDMLPDTCGRDRVCAPAAMVDGNPESCTVLGASGVCIDLCFARMLGPASPVMRSGCGPTSVCLPCLIGKGRGMPGCE